jgi:hypothetical protein
MADTWSLARRASWMPSPDVEKGGEETELYQDLRCGVLELVAGVQRVLHEAGYEFFHPNWRQIVARNRELQAYMVVWVNYEREDRIGMRVSIPVERKHDFAVMNAIDRLVEELRKSEQGAPNHL